MTAVGIIAEYNPFHNGHKYHLEKSLELTGADVAVAVMSGNFCLLYTSCREIHILSVRM